MALIKSQLKKLPLHWQDRLRRFSRLRWLEKSRIVRRYGASFRAQPLIVARYVLLDPDVGDFIGVVGSGYIAALLPQEAA